MYQTADQILLAYATTADSEIVMLSSMSDDEASAARSDGRMFQDRNGYQFALRVPNWEPSEPAEEPTEEPANDGGDDGSDPA